VVGFARAETRRLGCERVSTAPPDP